MKPQPIIYDMTAVCGIQRDRDACKHGEDSSQQGHESIYLSHYHLNKPEQIKIFLI